MRLRALLSVLTLGAALLSTPAEAAKNRNRTAKKTAARKTKAKRAKTRKAKRKNTRRVRRQKRPAVV